MKKVLLFGISCFLLSSCVKEWTCDCVTVTTAYEEYGGDTVTKKESLPVSKTTKKEAEEICESQEINEQYPDGILKSVVKTCETNVR